MDNYYVIVLAGTNNVMQGNHDCFGPMSHDAATNMADEYAADEENVLIAQAVVRKEMLPRGWDKV